MNALVDQHGRVVKDLRISVTPRCNLKCSYCDPLGEGYKDPLGTLSVKEVDWVVRAAADLGMESVRFTGGEPLLRKELAQMIHNAKRGVGVKDVALTTNATLLKRRLPELLEAGLDRINISLDAVDPNAFKSATGGGSIKPVWEGVEAVLEAGLTPLKLNAVVIRGVNDAEIAPLAALSRDLPIHIRFIEYMHLNNAENDAYHRDFMPGREIRARVESAHGPLQGLPTEASAPAKLFKVAGWQGAIGFINPISEPFCGACSRMRITSDAKVRPCLLTDRELDVRPAFGATDPIAAIQEVFLIAAHRKVASGVTTPTQRRRTMVAIGG